ncbi:unnamed protein product [Spirodela intermedia]|uniref:Uncharacterized protein n=1 Tax=Spirodela intermedia TaxID=51605 RepID=A0A7I8JVN3_SPIIN|nr:unnamed protein product [Spirodela intermedia]
MARLMPAQILLPAPKGMTSKLFPLTSMWACSPPGRNREGRNSSGSPHTAGSRLMAHTFTRRVAPLGTW